MTRRAAASLSVSVEDYLKAIYDLARDGVAASTNDLADRVGVSAASVSGMLKRLSAQKLVRHERYRGVSLTAAGRRAALATLRRHRILECFLAERLGYAWDEVHAEAERLEHAVSDTLVERMAVALGDPTVDPHGAPIPTRDGTVDERRHVTLADAAPGTRAAVVRVGDKDPGFLRYLAELGVVPGAELTVAARAPFGDTVTVRVGRATHPLGTGAASRVFITVLREPASR